MTVEERGVEEVQVGNIREPENERVIIGKRKFSERGQNWTIFALRKGKSGCDRSVAQVYTLEKNLIFYENYRGYIYFSRAL